MSRASTSSRAERTLGILASVSYVVVMVLLGVPIWWKTTEVYRVSLPYSEIDALDHTLQTVMRADILLVAKDALSSGSPMQALLRDSSVYDFFLSSRSPTSAESQAVSASESVSELDQAMMPLHKGVLSGTVILYQLDRSDVAWDKGVDVVVGHGRTIYFAEDAAPAEVIKVVREVVLGETAVAKTLASIQEPSHQVLSAKEEERRRAGASDRGVLRRVPAAAGYDVLFSLLVPEPDRIMVTWNAPAALESYVMPLVRELENVTRMSVKSQVLYLQKLNLKPKRKQLVTGHGDATKELNVVGQKDLGLAINPVESQLASHVSSNPRLNFLTYVPTVEQSPLAISDESGKNVLDSNAFLIPRWGGVFVHNMPEAVSKFRSQSGKFESVKASVDPASVMGAFAAQLRLLIGLQDYKSVLPSQSVRVLPVTLGGENPPLRTWERDFLLRLRAAENLHLARATLQSLAHLLWQIPNIVIRDEIGDHVRAAVAQCLTASEEVELGRLEETFEASRLAFLNSDAAFFDPSLLELLYFPEDQKYAIYIPLFLPVGIPLVLSFWIIYDFVKKQFYSQKTKDD